MINWSLVSRDRRTFICLRILAVYLAAIIMFALRQWGKKFMASSSKKELAQQERINFAYETDEDGDLRLCERPLKPMNKRDVGTAKSLSKNHKAANESSESSCEADCHCHNCRALLNLTECAVCMESLQSSQIKSCPVCANIVCTSCDARLNSCAFCRSQLPAERNRALERLVDRLVLPCKNSRAGCKLLLDGESRFIHESVCNFSLISCPIDRGCGWLSTVGNVQSHLHDIHNLQALRDHGISVEIHSFRNKARAVDGREYTVCLACYEQLFVIRMVLFQGRLRLCFTRLGHEIAQPLPVQQCTYRHGVLVTVKAHAGRKLRALVPFGKYDREMREITVTCDNLYPRIEDTAQEEVAVCGSEDTVRSRPETDDKEIVDGEARFCKRDLVKIELLVKQLIEQ